MLAFSILGAQTAQHRVFLEGRRNPPSTDWEGTQHSAEHEQGNGVATPHSLWPPTQQGKVGSGHQVTEDRQPPPPLAPTTLKCSAVCVSN